MKQIDPYLERKGYEKVKFKSLTESSDEYNFELKMNHKDAEVYVSGLFNTICQNQQLFGKDQDYSNNIEESQNKYIPTKYEKERDMTWRNEKVTRNFEMPKQQEKQDTQPTETSKPNHNRKTG